MFIMTVCFSEAVICKYFHFDSTELDKSPFVLLQCNLFKILYNDIHGDTVQNVAAYLQRKESCDKFT